MFADRIVTRRVGTQLGKQSLLNRSAVLSGRLKKSKDEPGAEQRSKEHTGGFKGLAEKHVSIDSVGFPNPVVYSHACLNIREGIRNLEKLELANGKEIGYAPNCAYTKLALLNFPYIQNISII